MRPDYATPGEWARRGRCVGQVTRMEMPNLPKANHRRRHLITLARSICEHCPVIAECRDWALTDPDPCEGMVAGGMTPEERHAARGGVRSAS